MAAIDKLLDAIDDLAKYTRWRGTHGDTATMVFQLHHLSRHVRRELSEERAVEHPDKRITTKVRKETD